MADLDLQIKGGGGVGPPDPKIRQGVGPGLKKFFFLRPFGPQFALKSRGGGGQAGLLLWIRQ